MAAISIAAIIAAALANAGQIGAGVSALQGASGIQTDAELERLNDLRRRQELGLLGLSSAELANTRQEHLGPVQAAEREARARSGDILAGADVASGNTFRALQGEEARTAEARAGAMASIARTQENARQQQEKEILSLANQGEAEKVARQQAITQTVVAALGAGKSMMDATGAARGDKETQEAQEEELGTSTADLELLAEMLAAFGK